MRRRQFLKISAASAASTLSYSKLYGKSTALTHFGVHPFIDEHPDAVFIMRTSVDTKFESEKKLTAGSDFARSVFVARDAADSGAYPVSNIVAMKPNLTSRGNWMKEYTKERSMGVATDVDFVEGVIEGMKNNLGKPGSDFYIREVNGSDNLTDGGYAAMVNRTGADILITSRNVDSLPSEQVVWKDVPNGVWFNRIPYLWPVNAADTFLLNISKLKAHGMGMTLCAKNLQGTIAASYQQHCTAHNSTMSIDYAHVQADAKNNIYRNYSRHRADGIPRWDRPGQTGGLWQETWASRCIDNNSVTKPALHIIEGIYGHDGNFVQGPHRADNGDYIAQDFMMNYIIFGKNSYHVDIIGTWLSGHEPGNFGLFHLAQERGLSTLLNPKDIPLYLWNSDSTASLTPLDSFERTGLKTYYLQRDYNGQNEDYWHLCDEPYDYTYTGVMGRPASAPQSFELAQNYPNPFNGGTTIEYTLPTSGHVRIDILNSRGQRVDVVYDNYANAGHHMATWHPQSAPSGHYFYRCTFEGYTKTGRMVLVR